MYYKKNELQGAIILIFLLIWGIYSLFSYLYKISVVLVILTLIILFFGLYYLIRYYKRVNAPYTYDRGYERVNTVHLDERGYERDGNNKLIHRDIAYEHIYKEGYVNGEFDKRFGSYDVHHIDGNKRNNSPENLQVLTREEHERIHKK